MRQTSPYGTSAPQIFRPFTAGLLYSTVISVRPTVCDTLPSGLGRGNCSCALAGPADRQKRATKSGVPSVFILMRVVFLCHRRRVSGPLLDQPVPGGWIKSKGRVGNLTMQLQTIN